MFSKFQTLSTLIFSVALGASLGASVCLTGCAAENKTEVSAAPPKSPTLKKGTKTVSTIEGNEGLIKLVFNELSWSVRGSDIAINKIARDEQDGCVTYKRVERGSTFATARFNCSKQIALGGSAPSHRRVLNGQESYSEASSRAAFINMSSSLEQSLYSLDSMSLVGRGTFSRTLKLVRPSAPIAGHVLEFKTLFKGQVAQESGLLPEEFQLSVSGEISMSRATGLKLPKGATVSLLYAPERAPGDKATVSYVVSATSDLAYSSDGACLRPVGSFTYSRKFQGKTSTGTLTTSASGISIAGQPETIPWGDLCLEQ